MTDARSQPMTYEVVLPSLGNRPKRVDHMDRAQLLEAIEVVVQENGRLMSGRPTPQERLDTLKERIEAEVAAKYAALSPAAVPPPPLQMVVKGAPPGLVIGIAVFVGTILARLATDLLR